MTAYRVVVAERKDIVIVTVACEECGTAVSLNIETASVPMACGSCGKQWSENVKAALAGLGRFHREGKTAEEKLDKKIFRFEIKQAD